LAQFAYPCGSQKNDLLIEFGKLGGWEAIKYKRYPDSTPILIRKAFQIGKEEKKAGWSGKKKSGWLTRARNLCVAKKSNVDWNRSVDETEFKLNDGMKLKRGLRDIDYRKV